jgi:hypothetical protein
MSRITLAPLAAAFAFLLAPAAASADDFAGTALNIIPSGQYGGGRSHRGPTSRRRCTTR